MSQAKPQKKQRGSSRERMLEISKGTQWKKGQSGGGRGPLPEKAISEGLRAFYNQHPKEFKKLLNAAHRKPLVLNRILSFGNWLLTE